MADESIRQLQAELREVYRSVAKQKLSERNVVEIVSKLIELGLIEVLYTTDGRTYLTNQQLEKEIQDELTVHGGRISLVDLQQILNVDFSHIEVKVTQMVAQDSSLTLVLGQLIDTNYRRLLAEEINDLLQEKGHLNIVELTKLHDLPAELIREVVLSNMGTKINGQADPYEKDMFYTDVFVNRVRAQIRGALSAVTIPTTLGPIRQSLGCQEYLFHSVLEELMSQGRLSGTLSSGSRQDKSQFLPHIFSRAQGEWADTFFVQNSYLEYDALSRQGVSDPKDFINKRFKGHKNLVFLSSCCLGTVITDTVRSCIDEALTSGLWCDLSTILPSVLSGKDRLELLTSFTKKSPEVVVCGDSIVASNRLVTESMDCFKDVVLERAEMSATRKRQTKPDKSESSKQPLSIVMDESGGGSTTKDDRKEQRRKKAAVAGSSKKEGTGGREVKMKSTKKKGQVRGREIAVDSDEEQQDGSAWKGKDRQHPTAAEETFMSLREIEEVLETQAKLADCPPALLSLIASRIYRPLQREFAEATKSIFVKLSGAKQKKMAVDVQDRVNGLWNNMRLFERGLAAFEEPVHGQLVKHLLKTVGSDLSLAILAALGEDTVDVSAVQEEEPVVTSEMLRRIAASLPKPSQEPACKLIGALNGNSLESFYDNVVTLCGPSHLGILLKKPDKKVDRQLVFGHRQSLADQLRNESDPAMTLHLTSVLLFQTLNQNMLHIPGRLVPTVLQHIAPSVETDKMAVLSNMQDLVVKQARYKSDPEVYSEQELQAVVDELTLLVKEVKDIGLNTKKNSASASAAQE